eukprot:CAMPEP_0116062192 /NCGR_PEP_ID=MMETSP0322-20121206/7590_1 /TAXON_ID=163516 /ORGANISM="Leptocylindrus danicus var. apora, Strain B651" /LENGTH=385 /DNA_ID=CAMNT_0003547407 /DNA_START=596 /DNA_END=1750 /DNA_ORIENTATION=+
MKDFIVHTPARDEWCWDAPLIVRIGCLNTAFSLLSCLPHSDKVLGYPCKDIYSVEVSDVQVFVEKRGNIFNFHLLDKSLDIPDPEELFERISLEESIELENNNVQIEIPESPGTNSTQSLKTEKMSNVSHEETRGTDLDLVETISKRSPIHGNADEQNPSAEVKAQEIFSSLLEAVSTIGTAAKEDGKEGFDRAVRNHKKGFVNQLKKIKEQMGTSTNNSRGLTKEDYKKVASESLNVVKQLGKTVKKEFSDQVSTLKTSTSIPKKKGWVKKIPKDKFRFGWIHIKEMRIYTKEILLKKSMKNFQSDFSSDKNCSQGWGRPILLKSVPIRGIELASKLKDDSGKPFIGNTIDKVIDSLSRILMAEVAKTNSGRVLKNTLGEVFSW